MESVCKIALSGIRTYICTDRQKYVFIFRELKNMLLKQKLVLLLNESSTVSIGEKQCLVEYGTLKEAFC